MRNVLLILQKIASDESSHVAGESVSLDTDTLGAARDKFGSLRCEGVTMMASGRTLLLPMLLTLAMAQDARGLPSSEVAR